MDLLVILVNNFIYGMTGGQNAPTTPITARSSTMPFGNFERPFNLPHLAEPAAAPPLSHAGPVSTSAASPSAFGWPCGVRASASSR